MSDSTVITKLTGSDIFVESVKVLNFNIRILLGIIFTCLIYCLFLSIYATSSTAPSTNCKCIECSMEAFKNELGYKHINSSIARLSSVLDENNNPVLLSTGMAVKYLIDENDSRYYKYEIYGFLNLINKSLYDDDTSLRYVAYSFVNENLQEIGNLELDNDRVYKLRFDSPVNYTNIVIASVDDKTIQALIKGDFRKY
jgi:hypothetical protein